MLTGPYFDGQFVSSWFVLHIHTQKRHKSLRLCRSRLGSSSIAVDRRHPHAALAVESCTPRIQIDFDTLGTDDASARGQHALDDVLDSLRVRPFARLARQP